MHRSGSAPLALLARAGAGALRDSSRVEVVRPRTARIAPSATRASTNTPLLSLQTIRRATRRTIGVVVICPDLALSVEVHLRLPGVRVREEHICQRFACAAPTGVMPLG